MAPGDVVKDLSNGEDIQLFKRRAELLVNMHTAHASGMPNLTIDEMSRRQHGHTLLNNWQRIERADNIRSDIGLLLQGGYVEQSGLTRQESYFLTGKGEEAVMLLRDFRRSLIDMPVLESVHRGVLHEERDDPASGAFRQ